MSSQYVLVLNCGSSSLKFAVLDPNTGVEQLSGLAERLHLESASIKWKINGEKHEQSLAPKSAHKEALKFIVDTIFPQKSGLKEQIKAIGHRVVHGGEKFSDSVVITDAVIKAVEEVIPFAPLHNPAGLTGIQAAIEAFPELKDKQVGVFDTAFHQTMPSTSYLYALPYELYKKHGVRRYGFHGTSHKYVTHQAAKMVNKSVTDVNLITCHLGNGGSISAIRHGQSVDTSMGLTPLEGLVMGTRSGDFDPAIIFFLKDLGYSVDEINTLVNKKSGLLGLTEESSDCRYAEDNYETVEGAKRAMDVFAHRLAKYIGGYMTVVGEPLDAIVFTGGIGENSSLVRELVIKRLACFGYRLSPEGNLSARFGKSGVITEESSPVAVVIPTNEELVIAQDTATLCF